MVKSEYKTCPKCGNEHSTLVRHKCWKKGKAPPPPESGGDEGEGDGDEPRDGEGKGQETETDSQSGEGEGKGDGQGDGEGEGEGEQEAEGEGMPEAQPPEPEAPPVAVVCTVLKFAALCAQSAENGMIVVELTENGLLIYGHDGDERTASETIDWGEFEKRSTLDGEFMVRDAVKAVDSALIEAEATEAKPLPWDEVTFDEGDSKPERIVFADGTNLAAYQDFGNGTYRVGVPSGRGSFTKSGEHMSEGCNWPEATPFSTRCRELSDSLSTWTIEVDAYGRSVKDPTFTVAVELADLPF